MWLFGWVGGEEAADVCVVVVVVGLVVGFGLVGVGLLGGLGGCVCFGFWLKCCFFEATWVSTVSIIHFIFELVSGDN